MASALKVLGKQDFTIENIQIDRIKQSHWDRVRREILMCQNYEPTTMPANCGFGFNGTDRSNAGLDPITGKIKTNTAQGKMLQVQISSWKLGLGSFMEKLHETYRFILGKTIKGASQSHLTEYVR
jgi:hypothetical protein